MAKKGLPEMKAGEHVVATAKVDLPALLPDALFSTGLFAVLFGAFGLVAGLSDVGGFARVTVLYGVGMVAITLLVHRCKHRVLTDCRHLAGNGQDLRLDPSSSVSWTFRWALGKGRYGRMKLRGFGGWNRFEEQIENMMQGLDLSLRQPGTPFVVRSTDA